MIVGGSGQDTIGVTLDALLWFPDSHQTIDGGSDTDTLQVGFPSRESAPISMTLDATTTAGTITSLS